MPMTLMIAGMAVGTGGAMLAFEGSTIELRIFGGCVYAFVLACIWIGAFF